MGLLPATLRPARLVALIRPDRRADCPNRVRRTPELVVSHVRSGHRMTGGSRGLACGSDSTLCCIVGGVGRRACLSHRDLAARPCIRLVYRRAWSSIARVLVLE